MKPSHAQGVQIVWFPARQEILSAEHIFQSIFERAPETVNSNRVPSPSTPYLSQAKSLIDNLVHTVMIEPGRISIVIHPNQEGPAGFMPVTPLPFAEFDEVWTKLSSVIDKLNSSIVEASVRIALILGAIYQADNMAEANRLFSIVTGVETSEDTQDLIYQRNDRLDINEVLFNRVENFTVNNVELVQMQPVWQGSVGFNPASNQSVKSSFVAGNLDYNTVVTGRVYEFKEIKEQFELLRHTLISRILGANNGK